MNNDIINDFINNENITFKWNGKKVWIAKQIAELTYQIDARASIVKFIQDNQKLKDTVDYEIIKNDDLVEFKKLFKSNYISSSSSRITIFYESGLKVYLSRFPFLKENINKQSIYDNIKNMNVALETTRLLANIIDENTINKNIKVDIVNKVFKKMGIDISINQKRNNSVMLVRKYKCEDIVDTMLESGFSYKKISSYLKEKNIIISKSAIARYAKKYSSDNTITIKNGGNSND